MEKLPIIHEGTFGQYVESVYGYSSRENISPEDSDVLEMVAWTVDDPKGPRIGWDEPIHWWSNTDDYEQIWRHRPTLEDLNEHLNLRPEAIARRGV